MERLASEFTRLLGDSNTTSKTVHEREAADASSIMARLEESNATGGSGSVSGGLDMLSSSMRPKTTTESNITSSPGWAKRIRGLLFVLVRELVRSLDRILGSTESKEKHVLASAAPLLPAKGQSVSVSENRVEFGCSIFLTFLDFNSPNGSFHGRLMTAFLVSDHLDDKNVVIAHSPRGHSILLGQSKYWICS